MDFESNDKSTLQKEKGLSVALEGSKLKFTDTCDTFKKTIGKLDLILTYLEDKGKTGFDQKH